MKRNTIKIIAATAVIAIIALPTWFIYHTLAELSRISKSLDEARYAIAFNACIQTNQIEFKKRKSDRMWHKNMNCMHYIV